jgi:hypothetical protein
VPTTTVATTAAMVPAAWWTAAPEASVRRLPTRGQAEHQAADQQQEGDRTRECASVFGRVARTGDNTQYGPRKEQPITPFHARFSGSVHARDFTPSVPLNERLDLAGASEVAGRSG